MIVISLRRLLLFALPVLAVSVCLALRPAFTAVSSKTDASADFIKWVDFNVSYEAMSDAMEADISSYGTDSHCSWIDLLACLAAVNGNDFSNYKKSDLTALTDKLNGGSDIEELTKDLKYFPYYQEAFGTVLGEFIGPYSVQTADEDTAVWEKRYGLKVFCPIANGFYFDHYDDFGNSRTYGYSRRHTGHDLFGSIGTPVVAIEGGVIEHAGWNQYGGWRIGIRSFDTKRYYYYAHLRKDHPYTPLIEEGETVKAGDVIGYLGMTGYSTEENVNNINVPHLHVGMQLIFDESQTEGPTEIWIDMYDIIKLLQQNLCEVYKDEDTGEYVRKYDLYEK